jgi:hypothetical protein
MQAMVDGMMEELEAKNKKSADFFKHEFQDTLYLYVNHLKKEGSLDDESYSFPFDREKYAIAYEIIEQFASNTNLLGEDPSCPFPNHQSFLVIGEYRIVLDTMHGQGTSTMMRLVDGEEGWRADLAFTLDELLSFNTYSLSFEQVHGMSEAFNDETLSSVITRFTSGEHFRFETKIGDMNLAAVSDEGYQTLDYQNGKVCVALRNNIHGWTGFYFDRENQYALNEHFQTVVSEE